jgi:hypothetical protein
MMMADFPDSVPIVSLEDRARLQKLGEAYVRQLCSGGVHPPTWVGTPDSFKAAAVAWLAELDEEARKRNEAFQAEQTRLGKSTLRVAWIASGLAALGIIVTGGLWYAQDQKSKVEVAHNRMIKEGIGLYIGNGRAILDRFGRNEMPMPIMDEVGWVGRTEDFLRTNLGESYVNRFNDVSGLGSVTGNGTDVAHNAYFNNIYGKITRLEEFSHELP